LPVGHCHRSSSPSTLLAVDPQVSAQYWKVTAQVLASNNQQQGDVLGTRRQLKKARNKR
jgi:hypothetical protein